MSIVELDTVTPSQIVNCRPVTASMHEFFASSQLSQFMDQTNPLACLEHKRRISAMGPGGLSRERAGFDVRDVHPSHYGRICPVSTPEGPNIGLVIHLASYAKVNEFGFIETPYRTVAHTVKNDGTACVSRRASQNIMDGAKTVIEKDHEYTEKDAAILAKMEDVTVVPVRAYITEEVSYYNANEEKHMCVAQANAFVKENGELVNTQISARNGFKPGAYHESMITHMDIAPQQIISISTSLISFLEHDDNTRALMGSNMQRQAVPLIKPASPLVGTGVEHIASNDQCIRAPEDGEIKAVDANRIDMVGKSGKKYQFDLLTFHRTNQSTAIHQRPRVDTGDKVQEGDVLIDGASVENGELAVGQNLLVAYMPWRGLNFEDAVIVSDRIVKDGVFNSIHIDDYEMDVRDTKLGPEELTADIPNVGAHKLKDLDEQGIVRIGATVLSGDILAGKVTPKGETELSAEDRLLRAIFGEKAHDVRDTSLRLPRGSGGKIIQVEVLDRKNGDELPNGVLKRIKVYMAQMRHLESGDKMAGRHGNKGVISRIIPVEDMPYTEDGRPIDIILNPLGVSARMNIGQILETHLGLAAEKMGIKIATPALNGIKMEHIREFLKENDLPEDGKMQLFDGQTGESFDQRTVVGICYMLKLIHMVEDKVHARSVGPYSLVTQQPFGGKAQNGGQRFGEMEVWALEAHGAAHTLQEMLTIKSDDVKGRSACYESIVKTQPIENIGIPESFNVLIKELQSLCLKVDVESGGQKMSIQELERKVEQAQRSESESKSSDQNDDDDTKGADSKRDKKVGDDTKKDTKKKDYTSANDDKRDLIEESSDVSIVDDSASMEGLHEVDEGNEEA
jgi:DNA-directed RNA polymerase subunit beta